MTEKLCVAIMLASRALGFFSKIPGTAHPSTPKMLRIILSLAFASGASTMPQIRVQRCPQDLSLILACISEYALGYMIGATVAILCDGAYAGGRLIDDYLGIRSTIPTATVASGAEFGRLWSLAMLVGFMMCGGIERAIVLFVHTLSFFPLTVSLDSKEFVHFAIYLVRGIVVSGLLVVGPAITLAFLVQIGLAVLSRLLPRLSTFMLSFPIVYSLALVVTIADISKCIPFAGHLPIDIFFHE